MHHHRFREFFKDHSPEVAAARGPVGAFVPCPLWSAMGPEQLALVQDVYSIAAETVGRVDDSCRRHRHNEFSSN
jgi:hypothetical protein